MTKSRPPIASAAHMYSPKGMAAYRAYRDRVQQLVADGHLTQAEAHILCSIRMRGIMLEGGVDESIRQPKCQACGTRVPIIGSVAQTFRCPCSPDVEQSIADAT